MNSTSSRRFSLYTIVSVIVNGFMLMAAGISYSHIVQTSIRLGVADWQAYLVPAFVDGLAILGLIGRSDAMARQLAARGCTPEQIADIKRFGFRLQLAAGLVSLAANFYAGHTLGERLFGLLVVGGFVITEKYSEKLRATGAVILAAITAADVQAAVDAALAVERTQAAADAQAAITAAVDAALAKADRARKAKERRDAKRAEELRPVSPATQAEINASYTGTFEQYAPAYL